MPNGADTVNFYLGVDPGMSGGLALIDEHGAVTFATSTPDDCDEVLRLVDPQDRQVSAALERVWSSPGWGHAGAFTFGLSYGALRMALVAQRVPFIDVLPRAWQKALDVAYPKKATAPEKKNITKERAVALFPGTRVTHAIADALLLAEYARRMHR